MCDLSANSGAAHCRCGTEIKPGQRSCLKCLDGLIIDHGLGVLHRMERSTDPVTGEVLCVGCGSPINHVRMSLKHDKTCVGCQTHFEQVDRDRLRILASRTKRFGLVPRGPSDGTEARSTRGRLPRAAIV